MIWLDKDGTPKFMFKSFVCLVDLSDWANNFGKENMNYPDIVTILLHKIVGFKVNGKTTILKCLFISYE